ncbi:MULTISPECIES: hypothetical protein [unclassified Streptomyces]|uniref:hypothetical protein n=1 Tax=unclassified Streptomyces TaxID=2593676 RepID=UPI003796795C
MADESSTQPQGGMAALRARKAAGKKTAAGPKETKAAEATGETARRTPPKPMFPKAAAAEGAGGTRTADAPQEGRDGHSVAAVPEEQQPVRVQAAGPVATKDEDSDAGRHETVVPGEVSTPTQEPEAAAQTGEAQEYVRAAADGVPRASGAPEGDEAAPSAASDAEGSSDQVGDSLGSADIPLQGRTPERDQAPGSPDGRRVADAQEAGASVRPGAEVPPHAAASAAVGDQEVGEAAADGVRNGVGGPGATLERRSGQAAAAVTSQWDHHVPPPVNEGFPRAEEVLNQRFINREALNASVPAELQIPHRLQLLKVVSRINHIPPADLVAVAVDWFLRGGKASADDMLPPWNGYTGHGTPEEIRPAEVVLNERFISREPLKSQVPADLQLNHRLAMYRVLNRLDKMPVADIVTVALDRWLRVMGF